MSAEPLAAMKLVVAVTATVFISAVPSEPPTCCDVLITADATPASWCPTPCRATVAVGMKLNAIPTLMISIEGSTDATQSRPWAFVAGAALRFGPVHVRVGGGYGNIFVPRIGVFTPKPHPQPDFDFFVRF